MTNEDLYVQPLGDRAFLLTWNTEHVHARNIAAAAGYIRRLEFPWLQELVPAYRTIAIHIGSIDKTANEAAEELMRALKDYEPSTEPYEPKVVELPVVYGGGDGPDLEASAARSRMTTESFAAAHRQPLYEVAMIGFAPGFPYLIGLPEQLAQPRHRTPRRSVQAGSVGIAGGQTGVYSVASPGGWQIIGRTTERLFRPEGQSPFLLAPGDLVKFVPALEETHSTTLEPVIPMGSAPPALTVRKPGLHTTVQDAGRLGWRAYGVSVGGAMDSYALRMANILVGNDEDDAGLEFTLTGATFTVERDVLIALSGAPIEASVDSEALPMNKPIAIRGGTTLSLGRIAVGCRTYMAVAGGIDAPLVLGSRSSDPRARIGGSSGNGSPLSINDSLACGSPSALSLVLADELHRRRRQERRSWATVSWQAAGINLGRREPVVLRVLLGAEWERFDDEARSRFLGSTYQVGASSDRMGLRLSGPSVTIRHKTELISHGVCPGTIQVPPDGQPIVLAAGCQPTGGYPKAAHVIAADDSLLAQLTPGDLVRFETIDERHALLARQERERDIALLKAGIFARINTLTIGGR